MKLNADVKVERVGWAAANVSMTTVSWLVVIVTLARYCAVCRPLDTLQIGRSKRVRKVGTLRYTTTTTTTTPRVTLPNLVVLGQMLRVYGKLSLSLPLFQGHSMSSELNTDRHGSTLANRPPINDP